MTNAPSEGISGVSSIMYAPKSAMIFTCRPVNVPSCLAPIFT